jgi:hypothetical protein
MNDYWQILVEKFEEFSNDPTSLIKGDCIFDNEHLITKGRFSIGQMCLQIAVSAFLVISSKAILV